MTTLIGIQTDLPSLLIHLIKLDFDAIDAYDVAIARVSRAEYREPLEDFRDDHVRNTEMLTQMLYDRGVKPPDGPDLKRVLLEGKVRLASLVSDRAILYAMKTTETDMVTAYDRATRSPSVTPQLRDLLLDGLLDERRHRAWLREQFAGEQPPYASPPGFSL